MCCKLYALSGTVSALILEVVPRELGWTPEHPAMQPGSPTMGSQLRMLCRPGMGWMSVGSSLRAVIVRSMKPAYAENLKLCRPGMGWHSLGCAAH